MKLSKEEQVLWDCYRELYASSTPKGDFDELIKNAEINEKGEKVVPFDDYEIDVEKAIEIIDKYKKKFKYKWKKNAFSSTIHLGCSPKFKQNDP